MKKLIICSLVLAIFMSAIPVYAAEGGQKGASGQAYEHASEEAVFHRVGDWFTTIGKSKEEKAAIIAERRAERATARAQKKAEKQARKTERKAEKTQKRLEKRMRGSKK